MGLTKLSIEKLMWEWIQKRIGETNLIATNSYMEMLPTPFYVFSNTTGKRYLFWYSNNNFPSPSQDGFEAHDNRIDFACRSEVDAHLVWTSDFADSIRNRNSAVEIQVVGSLMMYPKRAIEPLEGLFNIVLFDMTPWEGYPPMMFGSELFMSSFIKDIVDVSLEFPGTRVYLKPKRKFVRNGGRYTHSSSYLALIDGSITEGLLNLLDPTTNIYGLCERADLILGFPFASPAIIANELSKPSFYYNPEFSKHWKIRQSMDNVSVISGKENLRLKMQEIYNLKNSRFNES
jgi:polysaccharide biosynthesis PFTS motif protein